MQNTIIDLYIDAEPADEELAREIRQQLRGARFQGEIRSRNEILPGDDIARCVERWVGTARVVVLLWSVDALGSESGRRALDVARKRDPDSVFAIVARPCLYQRGPFRHVLPEDGIELSGRPDREAALLRIARSLLEALTRPDLTGWRVVDADERDGDERQVPCADGAGVDDVLATLVDALSGRTEEPWSGLGDDEDELRSRQHDMARWNRPDRWSKLPERWIFARGELELRAKRERVEALRTYPEPLRGWDGRALDTGSLAPWRLQRDDGEMARRDGARGRDSAIPHLHENMLLAAFYGLATAPDVLRGVVIIGAPGSGKSLLSRVAERRFLRGPLSALGFAVRKSARELVAQAADNPGSSLHRLLEHRGDDPRLFDELVKHRRLFLILDGLDEIGPRALRALATLLQQNDVPFLATSRELPHGLDLLPAHARLRIEPLRRDDVLRVLRDWDRPDLAGVVESLTSYSDFDLGRRNDPVVVLCRTPFHLALLCKAVRRDEPIPLDGDADLYRRVFQELVDHAVEDRRLREEQADVLRRQGHVMAGNLAISWLRSETGRLTDTEVTAALESAGLAGKDVLEVQRALEFGYLLAPGADNIEFTHRTIAEWVAARALAHRVRAAIQRSAQAGKPLDAAGSEEIEQRELGPFLEVRDRDVRPPSWPLLRFYMPEAVAPLAVVRRFLGPQMFENEGLNVVERSFEAAFELASLARWSEGDPARTAWSLFVRATTFTAGGSPHEPTVLTRVPSAQVAAFAERVAAHLPHTLPELVSLAARNEEQADQLRRDPTVIVRFCPQGHVSLFEELLKHGSADQQQRILEQYVVHGEALPYEVERRWPLELPDRIARASDHRERHALEQVEKALHEALNDSSREIPWDALRRRMLDWPHHLRGVLAEWLCLPERRETRYGFAHDGPTSTALRTDMMSILLERMTTSRGALVNALREAAKEPDAKKLAGDLQWKIERDEGDDPWPRFVAIARTAGWVLERGLPSFREAPHARTDPLSSAFAEHDDRRKQVHALLSALRGSARLEAVAGPLWRLLPPEDEQRAVLLEGFIAVRSIPACVAVEDVIEHFGEADQLPHELTDEHILAPVHEQRLRELARSGTGRLRFLAVLWCAHHDEKAADEMVALLADGDPEFRGLVSGWVQSRGRWLETRGVPALPPESLARAPLAYRATANDPGWRAELLQELEAEIPERDHELCEIVRRHRVREALPLLVRRYREAPSRLLADTIAALLEPADREAIELLISTDHPEVGLPKRVLSFLSLADLPRILSRQEPPGSLYPPSGVGDRLARFGPGAHAVLLDAFRARSREAKEKTSTRQVLRAGNGSAWVDGLRRAVLRTVDVTSTSMEAIVALLEELFQGDRHDVYSTPGPLGSDFDEPHDLEYSSKLRFSDELRLANELVKQRLELHPDEARSAARLLQHPSETLQLAAFEALASKAEPHEVAALAVRALEGHLRATDTDFEGETAGLFLASVTRGGSGSIDVHRPEVGRKLAEAVRRHLTGAHRGMLAALVKHQEPRLRRLACKWIGELGGATWVPMLAPALADRDARVVMAALQAWRSLDCASLATALVSASRSEWTHNHHALVLDWLAHEHPRALGDLDPPTPRRVDAILPVDLVATLVGEALGFFSAAHEPPAALETLLTTLGEGPHTAEGSPLSTSALQARAEHGGPEMQAILLRALAARGGDALPEDVVSRLSSASLDDRLAAAESLAKAGRTDLAPQIIDAWDEAFRSSESPDATALRLRLARMLEDAPAVLAPLWLHLLDDLPWNDLECCLEEAGEELLRLAVWCLRRWGAPGLERLIDTVPSDPERWKADGEACGSVVQAFGAKVFRRSLQARAGQHPAFADLAAELPEDRDERTVRLERFVALEVLPEGWWRA